MIPMPRPYYSPDPGVLLVVIVVLEWCSLSFSLSSSRGHATYLWRCSRLTVLEFLPVAPELMTQRRLASSTPRHFIWLQRSADFSPGKQHKNSIERPSECSPLAVLGNSRL